MGYALVAIGLLLVLGSLAWLVIDESEKWIWCRLFLLVVGVFMALAAAFEDSKAARTQAPRCTCGCEPSKER